MPIPLSKASTFSVAQADGRIVSGTYTVTCQENEGRSTKSTTFTVSGNEPSSQLTKVVVTPPSGEYAFVMDVEYTAILQKDQAADKITCTYRSPSGKSAEVGSIIPSVTADKLGQPVKLSESLIFTVKAQDGKVETGVYEAACSSERNSSSLTTNFTVVEAKTDSSMYPIMGKIILDYGQSSNNGIHGISELMIMTQMICSPEADPKISISQDGILVNTTCKDGTNPPVHLSKSTFTYKVEGTVDSTGYVKFVYEIYQYGLDYYDKPSGVWHITLIGTGKFTSPTAASGTATFTYECNDTSPLADVNNHCGTSSSSLSQYAFSGELPWSFVVIEQ
jgi:hypothetical protein